MGSVETRTSKRSIIDLDAETSILRLAFLGDVEAAHELDACDQGLPDAVAVYDLFLKHSVDTLANAQELLLGLDVNIRGLHAHGVVEHALDELDDRRVCGALFGCQRVNVEIGRAELLIELLGQRDDLVSLAIDEVDRS